MSDDLRSRLHDARYEVVAPPELCVEAGERIAQLEADLAKAREDSARLDWLESINPIGCWDGWIEQGESSHAVTVWLGGDDGKTPREAIDAARADEGEGRSTWRRDESPG